MARWFTRGDRDRGGAPKAFVEALDAVLEGLRASAPQLPGEVRSYVLTGEPTACLPKVASSSPADSVLLAGYVYGRPPSADLHQSLYAVTKDVPAEVLLRWARVLETRVKPNPWTQELADIDGGRTVESLLRAVATASRSGRSTPDAISLSHEQVEDVLAADGSDRAAVLVRSFANPTRYQSTLGNVRTLVGLMPGFDEAVLRHRDAVRTAVASTDLQGRLLSLQLLARLRPDTLETFASELVGFATSSSSQVREAATPLVRGPAFVPPLREVAVGGKPEQRLQALRLLHAVATDPADQAWAEETAEADRAPSVKALAAEWSAAAAVAADPSDPEVHPDHRPRPVVTWDVAVTPAVRATLDALVADTNRAIEKANDQAARAAAAYQAQYGRVASWTTTHRRIDPGCITDLVARIEKGTPPVVSGERQQHVGAGYAVSFLPSLAGDPDVPVAVLAHVLAHFQLVRDHGGGLANPAVECLNARHAALGELTLDEVAVLLDDMRLDGAAMVLTSYGRSWQPLGRGWSRESVAPFVAAHLDAIAGAVGRHSDYTTSDESTYRAIGTLSSLPQSLVEALFPVALSGPKAHRPLAQAALEQAAGRDARIITALSDGKSDVRTEAARWVARLKIEAAVPALEKAFATEKQDVTKGALLDALEALGRPATSYLDRATLAAQARTSVAKGLPKELEWFPWAALPTVHWADDGELVETTTLQSLLAQAVKAKSAEPNAILRRYCAMFEPLERRRLGQFVLDTWIAHDLEPVPPEAATATATQRAQWIHHSMTSSPQYYANDPRLGMTVEQLTAGLLPAAMREPAGSATSSKGLLAVAAACAGEGAAASASRYLQEWYGMRAAQGKALIGMLAWIDHPSATQLMLSVGSRFRTKSFQEEATRQAEAMAERKGWTLSELADRTIPTAGLDENGVLTLSYGEREFTATLNPDLSLLLRNPDGAKVSSLPTPRQTDDAQRAKESKAALASARKEVKGVVKLQAERLYEALCTDRDWDADDWDRYLNRHPLMRLLVRRLVWAAQPQDGEREAVLFRPLDDGSLTDVDDEEVTLAPGDRVRLAHDSNVPADAVAAWSEHLVDYEVAPLFQQFGKGTFELGESRGREKSVTDFRGCLVESFSLRGRATRLGYTRGGAEDGGWFYSYEKRFPTLGISTRIEFSGSSLPEESRTVALTTLGFSRHGADGQSGAMLLEDVPAVLLSEAYNDMRILAGDGAGPDPDWESKVNL